MAPDPSLSPTPGQNEAEALRMIKAARDLMRLAAEQEAAGRIDSKGFEAMALLLDQALTLLASSPVPPAGLSEEEARENLKAAGWKIINQEYNLSWTHPAYGDRWFTTPEALARLASGTKAEQ